jgi:hypothetical protein
MPQRQRQIRPNVTMPPELWQELKKYVQKQNDPDVTASSIVRRLVREFLEHNATKGRKRR